MGEVLTRRGFLLGAGAIAVASQVAPLARAVEWAQTGLLDQDIEGIQVAHEIGRIVRVAGSGVMGDGLIVAAPGRQVMDSHISLSNYGRPIFPSTPIRRALEYLEKDPASTVHIPDFQRRAAEVADLMLADPELAAVCAYAKAAVRGRGRRIITT